MFCKICNGRISESARLCNHCGQSPNQKMKTDRFPKYDMYENEVNELIIDEDKKMARNNYLISMSDRHGYKENNTQNNKNVFKMIGWIFSAFAVFIICIKTLSIMAENETLTDTITAGFLMFMLIYVIFVIIAVTKIKKRNEPFQNKVFEMLLHENKDSYYFSKNVIGYVKKDHIGNKITYYAYYEIDKTNIRSIDYDSEFGEYILFLDKPVYSDFNLKPKSEFRIHDIFSDIDLTNALGFDLPPKFIAY